jgi:hypothetical protein
MKFYFNANNKSQVSALRRVGAKNIMLTYKFVGERANKLSNGFDNIILGPGFGSDKDKYHEFIQDWDHEALQYDDPNDALRNYKNWKEGEEYNKKLIPILHQNYAQSLSIFKPNYNGNRIALGKSQSRNSEDTQLRQLPQTYSYHGLAKGRWTKDRNCIVDSIDSTTWTSGVRGRKTDVWKGQQLLFGEKGKNNRAYIQLACQKNLIYLSKAGLDPKNLIDGDNSALTLAPLVLYYMPMFHDLGCYEDNFKL